MTEDKSGSSGGGTGLEELREEISHLLTGLAQDWVEKAGDKVSGLTDRMTEIAEGQGGAAAAGARILRGESPVKAMFKQKVKDTKDKLMDKAKEALGGGGSGGSGGSKAMNIIETLDVGVPVRIAYDHWTQLEEFPGFAKGVQSVSMDDEITSKWTAKIAFSSRSWKSTILEQVPDERIRWESEGNKGTTSGVVSFHELAPDLTRIIVVVEYRPDGFVEKTANLWRAQGRRLRLDLKHFGRHVTMNADEEIEGWRGEIQDGEVVRTHEEGLEDDEAEDQDNEELDEEEELGDEDESEEEDEENHEEEEDQDEKRPRGRRTRAKSSR